MPDELCEPRDFASLRERLGLIQLDFARLLSISVRSLAGFERTVAPTDPVVRKLTELRRLTDALSEVIRADAIGSWFRKPNPAFGGSKPLEVVERGESDQRWEMIYFLRSGVPA